MENNICNFDRFLETTRMTVKILSRSAAAVNPGKYHAALVGLAKDAGALFFERTPANSIEGKPGSFLVKTRLGTIRCKAVGLATNGHSGKLTPFLRRRIIPVTGTVIATGELPEELTKSLLPDGSWCVDTHFGFRCFCLSPDGKRLIFAKAGLPGSFRRDIKPYARRVYKHMIETFPQLDGVALDYAWPASVGVTLDGIPHLGSHEGVWHAAGFNGHGVAITVHLGNQMARRILGGQHKKSVFEEIPFPTSVFYNGNTWFMPVIRQMLKIWDLRS
jgi:gamma-glutamylputrescine oxidase